MAKLTVAGLAMFAGLTAASAGAATAPPKPAPDLLNEPEQGLIAAAVTASKPKPAAPGVTYRLARLADYGLAIHVWVFDAARYDLRVAEQKAATGGMIGAFLDRPRDVFAINGGFFERDDDERLTPSGLLVIDGRIVAPEHERAGSGIVYSGAGGVAIAYRAKAPPRSRMDQALQVGPVLVDPGGKVGIYKNSHDRQNRSALCLRTGAIVFVVVDGGLSLYQLAHLLAARSGDGGLGCDMAINLDGGPSTQAQFRSGPRRIEVPGEWPVENALVISSKPE